jgi:hypothetical protein
MNYDRRSTNPSSTHRSRIISHFSSIASIFTPASPTPSRSLARFFNLSEPSMSESQTHPNHQETPPEFSRRPSLFNPPPALTPNRFPRHPPNERTFSLTRHPNVGARINTVGSKSESCSLRIFIHLARGRSDNTYLGSPRTLSRPDRG